MHVLSLPPAFVLSQDQTLRFYEIDRLYWSRILTRTHRHQSTEMPDDLVSLETCTAEVSSNLEPDKPRGRQTRVPQDSAVHVSLSSYSLVKERGDKISDGRGT